MRDPDLAADIAFEDCPEGERPGVPILRGRTGELIESGPLPALSLIEAGERKNVDEHPGSGPSV